MQRKKTLLPQWLDRNRSGAIVDRRFGEDDPTMTPEEKALQRFTFERQRKASKSSLFNLGDNEDGEAATGGTLLTHYGQNLDEVRGALADQEDLFHKSLTTRHIPEIADPAPEADTASRKRRSKAEIMEEVIAKSKAYKVSVSANFAQFSHCEANSLRYSTSDRKRSMKTRRSDTPSTMTWPAYAASSVHPIVASILPEPACASRQASHPPHQHPTILPTLQPHQLPRPAHPC